MDRLTFTLGLAFAVTALAEKPLITYQAPPAAEDDRPLIIQIFAGTQGTQYAFRLGFNREPWGDGCKTRCANATFFVDTDNDKSTGLKTKEAGAAENGADLAITIQGLRLYGDSSSRAALRAKIRQLTEASNDAAEGQDLGELDATNDSESLLAQGKMVYLLVDANAGSLPVGKKMRVIYHPPDSKPLVGTLVGLLTGGGGRRVEVFKSGKGSARKTETE